MKVLFSGIPYFTKKIVEELNEFDSDNKYIFCDTYSSQIEKLRFIRHLFGADLVVSFNGASSKSGSLDAAILFKKPLLMQWHGSDVLSIDENIKNGKFTDKYIKYARSYTDADWLKASLHERGVEADILHFKHAQTTKQKKPFTDLQVLTYLGKGKEEMYGIKSILKLADKYPEILFNVIGSMGKNCPKRNNIQYHGWVSQEEKEELQNRSPIFIRLTSHDGFALSIMEALAAGCYVIWNNPHPKCYIVNEKHGLIDIFERVYQELRSNGLKRNIDNINWVDQNFNKNKILSNYIKTLKEVEK